MHSLTPQPDKLNQLEAKNDLAMTLRKTQLSFVHDDKPALRDPKVWAPYVLVESR